MKIENILLFGLDVRDWVNKMVAKEVGLMTGFPCQQTKKEKAFIQG